MTNRVWQAGDLKAEFEDGGLRYVTWRGVEIARGIYAAVRDRDWGTVMPRLHDLVVTETGEEVAASFTCEHLREEIDFVWAGKIRISPRRIRFDFDGLARSSFLRNRIGFCVLHPMEFAGKALTVQTADETVEGVFPEAISPHQPFKRIQAMTYEPIPGLRVRMTFHGDLFEMEDQRNWTDASYKTYCTPLDLPFPVRVQAGERIRQSLEMEVVALPADGQSAYSAFAGMSTMSVTDEPCCRLPEIGFTLADSACTEGELFTLKALQPSFLRLVLDLTQPDWLRLLQSAAETAGRLGCDLELETIAGDIREMDSLLTWIADRAAPVRRVLPFRNGEYVSDGQLLQAVKGMSESRGLTLEVGGGTRAYYAEFNRARLPLDQMEFAAYTVNPQVHAFDERSIMETLDAQTVTALDATNKTGKPLVIGPITLKPRLNPNATSGLSLTVREQSDARLNTLFAAAWSLGSVAALSRPHVKGIIYFALAGPLGLVEGERIRPPFQVFKDLAVYQGATVLQIKGQPGSIAVLALRKGERRRILLANLTAARVETELVPGDCIPESLATYSDDRMIPVNRECPPKGRVRIALGPYGYCRLDAVSRKR